MSKRKGVEMDDIIRDIKAAFDVVRSEMTGGYTRGIAERQGVEPVVQASA